MEKLNLNQKLLAIQEEIGAIKKDQVNPHFKNTYFDINSLLEVLKPVLNKHKIVLMQPLQGGNMRTVLLDTESNVTLESEVLLPTNPDPQKCGAIISYFRRYSLTSLLALEAEDTDANDTAPMKDPVGEVTKVFAQGSAQLPPSMEPHVMCTTCGDLMAYKTGEKNGKSWRGYFCNTKGHPVQWAK